MIKKFLVRLKNKLKEDKKLSELIVEIVAYVIRETKRRVLWKVKNLQIKRLANGKKIWVIKSPEPDDDNRFAWGEYYFAKTLKHELEQLGYYVVIDAHQDWGCAWNADIVLVLGGCFKYYPDRRNKKCKYIFWHLCHPDRVQIEEYELYDFVLVASDSYAKHMEKRTNIPIKAMHSCVDTSIFFPKECDRKYDYVFVGNTRGKRRPLVMWCEDNQIPLHIWGSMTGTDGWRNYVKQDTSIVLERTISNAELPELYRSAGVVVNDHFEDMLRTGFFANRILEVLACGCPLLSDYSQEIENIFGDSILYCRDEEEFLKQLKYLQEHYEEQKEKVLSIRPKLQEEFSFEVRAKELAELTEQLLP